MYRWFSLKQSCPVTGHCSAREIFTRSSQRLVHYFLSLRSRRASISCSSSSIAFIFLSIFLNCSLAWRTVSGCSDRVCGFTLSTTSFLSPNFFMSASYSTRASVFSLSLFTADTQKWHWILYEDLTIILSVLDFTGRFHSVRLAVKEWVIWKFMPENLVRVRATVSRGPYGELGFVLSHAWDVV